VASKGLRLNGRWFSEVWQIKELAGDFLDLWQVKDLGDFWKRGKLEWCDGN
jgi:hypothetical protein